MEINLKVNTFVKIIQFEELTFKKVIFYTVQFEDNEYSEYEDFILRHSNNPDIVGDIINLDYWIRKIGDEIGALANYFRNESYFGNTQALPPPRYKMGEIVVKDLRLYCMRIDNSRVILFNGGIKTKDNAKDCPNVAPYFKQANKLAETIDRLLSKKEIVIKDNEEFSL